MILGYAVGGLTGLTMATIAGATMLYLRADTDISRSVATMALIGAAAFVLVDAVAILVYLKG